MARRPPKAAQDQLSWRFTKLSQCETEFRRFVDEGLVTKDCEGLLKGCKHCLKLMYDKRNAYLATWINLYLAAYDRVVTGSVKMPPLYWYHAPTAVGMTLQEAHQKRCLIPLGYGECTCGVATVLRYMYPGKDGNTLVYSLDVILDWFVGMLKKRDTPGPGSLFSET